MIVTPRLQLCAWDERHRLPFAGMLADPEVMRDWGGPLGAAQSSGKFEQYRATFRAWGFCRWAIEDAHGRFLGYTGMMASRSDHPLGPHVDIGWRLVRSAWGFGYATEAARASLEDFFGRGLGSEVLAYTTPANVRSQAVMERLGLERDRTRDYVDRFNDADFTGMVWVARPA